MQDIETIAPAASAAAPHRGHFRLPLAKSPVGSAEGGHRSGWPYVVAALAARQGADGILIDQFVEDTFKPGRVRPAWLQPAARALKRLAGGRVRAGRPWTEPWIGIFHLPPNFPEWFDPQINPRRVLSEPRFRRSLPHLRGGVAFSEYHAAFLRERLQVPVLAVKHPTERTPVTFDWAAFERNPQPRLVQVGWYLRNYRAIYQVPVPAGFTKTHLLIPRGFVLQSHRRTDRRSPYRHRPEVGTVETLSWLPNADYDRLLSENVMFLELFDASANNAVVEAIVRETPLVVNRHPAVAEYLGADYPLFYDALDEVPALLERGRIAAAHAHLRALDKSAFKVERFVDAVDDFARACRAAGARR